jgi:hypothetical protein
VLPAHLLLTNLINTGFIVVAAESAAMNMRQIIMAGVMGVSLFAMLSVTAERSLTQMRTRDKIWLDPSASGGLLAARLNITTVKKTRPAR